MMMMNVGAPADVAPGRRPRTKRKAPPSPPVGSAAPTPTPHGAFTPAVGAGAPPGSRKRPRVESTFAQLQRKVAQLEREMHSLKSAPPVVVPYREGPGAAQSAAARSAAVRPLSSDEELMCPICCEDAIGANDGYHVFSFRGRCPLKRPHVMCAKCIRRFLSEGCRSLNPANPKAEWLLALTSPGRPPVCPLCDASVSNGPGLVPYTMEEVEQVVFGNPACACPLCAHARGGEPAYAAATTQWEARKEQLASVAHTFKAVTQEMSSLPATVGGDPMLLATAALGPADADLHHNLDVHPREVLDGPAATKVFDDGDDVAVLEPLHMEGAAAAAGTAGVPVLDSGAAAAGVATDGAAAPVGAADGELSGAVVVADPVTLVRSGTGVSGGATELVMDDGEGDAAGLLSMTPSPRPHAPPRAGFYGMPKFGMQLLKKVQKHQAVLAIAFRSPFGVFKRCPVPGCDSQELIVFDDRRQFMRFLACGHEVCRNCDRQVVEQGPMAHKNHNRGCLVTLGSQLVHLDRAWDDWTKRSSLVKAVEAMHVYLSQLLCRRISLECPRCGVTVAKSGACNHVVCACGEHLCQCCHRRLANLLPHPMVKGANAHAPAPYGTYVAVDEVATVQNHYELGGWRRREPQKRLCPRAFTEVAQLFPALLDGKQSAPGQTSLVGLATDSDAGDTSELNRQSHVARLRVLALLLNPKVVTPRALAAVKEFDSDEVRHKGSKLFDIWPTYPNLSVNECIYIMWEWGRVDRCNPAGDPLRRLPQRHVGPSVFNPEVMPRWCLLPSGPSSKGPVFSYNPAHKDYPAEFDVMTNDIHSRTGAEALRKVIEGYNESRLRKPAAKHGTDGAAATAGAAAAAPAAATGGAAAPAPALVDLTADDL